MVSDLERWKGIHFWHMGQRFDLMIDFSKARIIVKALCELIEVVYYRDTSTELL